MYGFVAKIKNCYVSGVYPPKVIPTCSFAVAKKKLFLRLLESLEPPILIEKVHIIITLVPSIENIFVFSQSGFVCKGVKQHHNRIALHYVIRSRNHCSEIDVDVAELPSLLL